MTKIAKAFSFISFCIACSAKAECDREWVPYKDESCIKVFPDLRTYNEAKHFCASLENADSPATLVMVKEVEMQELLTTYTKDMSGYLWLGAKYDIASAQFKWEDGDSLTYKNWAEGYLRNDTDSCIQFVPGNAKDASNLNGKWQVTECQKRSLPICQRELTWSLKDAIREIRRLHKELTTVRSEVDDLNARVVPVGSIYIEYFNQSSPAALWPTLTWEDVTSLYAGLFFRASGGGSETWGVTQTNCAPQITQIQRSSDNIESLYNITLTLPSEGWSDYGHAGYYSSTGTTWYDLLRYNVKNCEVRPNNQAVRIWRRLA